jgi:hypothetical protein
VTAANLVAILIEADDVDSPEGMLDRNRDLAIRAAFLRHGWVVRSDGSYGKMDDGNEVRYIVHVDEPRPGYYEAQVSGERVHHHPNRHWVQFDIPNTVMLYEPTVSEDEFVTEIEERIVGEYGPDEDQDEYDRNQAAIEADERRDLDQDR